MKKNKVNKLKRSILSEKLYNFKKVVKAVLKRILDIIGGFFGTLLLIPITIIICILKIISGDFGPIFFVQERIGKNGKLFKMIKYRTMVKDADKILFDYLEKNPEAKKEYKQYKKLKDDPRITKIGKFLRKTSLDEIPQFINVLIGQMSLVGPRPYLPREREDMGEYYDYIILYKPGITGLWQVSGRNDVDFKQRLELDMHYHRVKTFRKDVKILVSTALITLKRKGAA